MSDQLQLRRGTTSQILAFTGAQGEVVVDTTLNALVVQNGSTAGGFYAATGKQVTGGTFYYNEDVGSAANAYILVPKANTNAPSSYIDGVQFGFVSAHPNTGSSTANFQGIGIVNLKYSDGTDPAAGDISGRVYLIYDATAGWMEIQRKSVAPPPQIRTLSASVASSALAINLSPANIDFRSPSLGSGTINRRNVVSAPAITVPSGATLGTQNGVQSQIVVLALDNAGTVQLGVVNLAGGLNLDESTLVNATAITSGSSLANVIYSTSSASGLPFRVMGFVQSTQATAGTWATSPSEVQGQGGQTIIGMPKITLAAPQATTTGTSIDFTGIPAGVKRVTMTFSAVSTNGTSNPQIQLGSGGILTTGYVSSSTVLTGAAVTQSVVASGFHINSSNAVNQIFGAITFTLLTGGTWACSGVLGLGTSNIICGGGVQLAGALDRVRLTTVIGTDVFDGGTINILYEG